MEGDEVKFQPPATQIRCHPAAAKSARSLAYSTPNVLPKASNAKIEREKIIGYLVNSSHP